MLVWDKRDLWSSSKPEEGASRLPWATVGGHQLSSADTRPKLYFAKMDIKSAFNSVKHDKMLQVMDELLDKVRLWRCVLADIRTTATALPLTASSFPLQAKRHKEICANCSGLLRL